jgi:hypothetical protein
MRHVLARCLYATFLLSCFAVAASAPAAPVALVTDVVGTGTKNGTALRLLAALPRNSEVSVADGGRVVVFYLADGTEWTLAGRGRFRLEATAPRVLGASPAPLRQPATAAFSTVRFRTDRATQGGLQMRGSAQRPMLVAPVDEVVLDGDVAFTWSPAGAGTRYRFELVDGAGAAVLVTDTNDATLRLPASAALVPGRAYVWAVSGRDPNAGEPFYRAAAFRVADAATDARLRAAKPPADAPFSQRVLYAALLEDAGAKSAALAVRAALTAERSVPWTPLH